jgi:hypothetical protein
MWNSPLVTLLACGAASGVATAVVFRAVSNQHALRRAAAEALRSCDRPEAAALLARYPEK